MEFEWDEQKARRNLRKHQIDFADAVTVFDDRRALTIADDELDEERYAAVGMDAMGRLLVVILYHARQACETDFSPPRD